VADDDKKNLDVLSQILSDIGVEVITTENGQQAMESALADKPDIMFMDIWMPVMDGFQVARQIISEFSEERPVLVAVSASALAHERQRYLDEGYDDFIPKPVDEGEVYECLAKILHVEYEYDDGDFKSIDFEKIVLPEQLFLRLKEAASFSEVTEFEESFDEICQIGEHGRLLAERLRELSQNLDMEGILDILGAINHE